MSGAEERALRQALERCFGAAGAEITRVAMFDYRLHRALDGPDVRGGVWLSGPYLEDRKG